MRYFMYLITGILCLCAVVVLLSLHLLVWIIVPAGLGISILLLGVGAVIQHQEQIEYLLAQQNKLLIADLQARGVNVE
jgi:hypothetical protein